MADSWRWRAVFAVGWSLVSPVKAGCGWVVMAGRSWSLVFDPDGWLALRDGWWRPLVGGVGWLIVAGSWWWQVVGGGGRLWLVAGHRCCWWRLVALGWWWWLVLRRGWLVMRGGWWGAAGWWRRMVDFGGRYLVVAAGWRWRVVVVLA